MKIYQENESLNVEEGVHLELTRLFSDRGKPSLVFVKGLGGVAGKREDLIDKLAEDYHVVTFSPRNSGNSNGNYTLTNFVSDSEEVIDHVSQWQGKRPFGIGHSIGGYTLAKLTENNSLVEKAVLLAPLIKMDEQNPIILNWYLKNCAKNKRNPFFLREYRVDGQRFSGADVSDFLKSIYQSSECDSELKSPTLVLLSGATCMRLPISGRKMKGLKERWEKLGAEVEVYQDLNHFFSGKWYQGARRVFNELEKPEFYERIKGFLSKSSLD